MQRGEPGTEFSGLAGRVLTGAISTGSLGAGAALGLPTVAVSAGLLAAGAGRLVLPFVLVVTSVGLARFALNGLFGEWSGGLGSEAGGPWPAVGAVALRYLALTFVWFVPLSILGTGGAGILQVVGGSGVVGALTLVAMAATPPLFLIVAVSADNVADVFSVDLWRSRFAGRSVDLLTIYAVYAGALWLLSVLALPIVAASVATHAKLGMFAAALAGCAIFGVSINLLGRLCGFFACTPLELPDGVHAVEPSAGVQASPPAPPQRAAAQATQPIPTAAKEVPRATPMQPVAASPAEPAGAEVPRPPALLAAKQQVDEALRDAAQDAAGALARLRKLDEGHAPHPLVLHAIAMTALAAHRVPEAVEAAERAIPLCIERGLANQAAEIFRDLRRHKVETTIGADALLAIGHALVRMDDLATAAKAFTAVITADPDHTRAVKGLLEVADLILHRKHNPEAAATVYRLVLSRCPHSTLIEFARSGLEQAERMRAHPHAAQ